MIPVLEIDDLILTESLPICEYIEELYEGKGRELIPKGKD